MNLKKGIALLGVMVLSLVVLTGCFGSNAQLDLAKAQENLLALESGNISRFAAEEKILQSGVSGMDSLTYKYNFDLEDSGIDFNKIEEYSINMNDETKDMWIMIKPMEGELETVKGQFDAYLQKMADDETNAEIKTKLENRTFEEIGGFLVYVVSEDNTKLIDLIKVSNEKLLNGMTTHTIESAAAVLSVPQASMEEVLMLQSGLMTNATTIIAVKPADGKEEEVKGLLETYIKNLEAQWQTYLPDQYENVKNRLEQEYEGYYIYIITDGENQLVYDEIIGTKVSN